MRGVRQTVQMRSRFLWIIAGAASAVVLLVLRQLSVASIFHAAVVFMLCCIAAHDVETRRIENGTVCTLFCLRLYALVLAWAAGVAGVGIALESSVVGAAVVLMVLLATACLSQRVTGSAGIGGGDIKLLSALGFWFGWEAGLAVAALSCVLLLTAQTVRARPVRQATFAFAPFIAVSSVCALLVM